MTDDIRWLGKHTLIGDGTTPEQTRAEFRQICEAGSRELASPIKFIPKDAQDLQTMKNHGLCMMEHLQCPNL